MSLIATSSPVFCGVGNLALLRHCVRAKSSCGEFVGWRVEAYDAPYAWLMAEYRITGAAFANL
jgi:hypothetical protein